MNGLTDDETTTVQAIASAALGHALDKRRQHALAMIGMLADYGLEGVTLALAWWGDTLAAYQPARHTADTLVALQFVDARVLTPVPADDVDPVERWTGRWLAARACLDHDMCDALLDQLDTPEQVLTHAICTLHTVAASLSLPATSAA